MKLIDLSKPIQYNRGDPFFMRVKIRHKRHATARLLVRVGLPFRFFPKDFLGWADDTITKMGVHSTTHIDAPYYGPTSGGAPAKSIDEIPLARTLHRARHRSGYDAKGRQRPNRRRRHGDRTRQDSEPEGTHHRVDSHRPRQASRHQGLLEDRHGHISIEGSL
jgi:hypothetical protein